jgi:hypothetical protein
MQRDVISGASFAQVINWTPVLGPLDQVFDLVSTARHWPRWHPATQSVRGDVDRPLTLGDRVFERARIGGRIHEGTWTVTEVERPTRLVLQTEGGRWRLAYAFLHMDAATFVRRELSYVPADFAGSHDPTLQAERLHRQAREALRRLKALVESAIATGSVSRH